MKKSPLGSPAGSFCFLCNQLLSYRLGLRGLCYNTYIELPPKTKGVEVADDYEFELVKVHKSMKEKSIYFLMAASGACIGFALTQAKDLKVESMHYWLAGALMCWALSFMFGFGAIRCVLAVTWHNSSLLQVRSGKHQLVRENPGSRSELAKIILQLIESKNTHLLLSEYFQVCLLIIGVAAYVVWQVLLMIQRSG